MRGFGQKVLVQKVLLGLSSAAWWNCFWDENAAKDNDSAAVIQSAAIGNTASGIYCWRDMHVYEYINIE